MESEKKNHSSNPSELQPYEEDTGKYTFDPKKDMVAPHAEGVSASVSSAEPNDFDDSDLASFGAEISDDADWDDGDLSEFGADIDENADFETKRVGFASGMSEPWAFDDSKNYGSLSEKEAKEKADEIIEDIKKKADNAVFRYFGPEGFRDQRMRLALVDAINKVIDDFPDFAQHSVSPLNFRVADLNSGSYDPFYSGVTYAQFKAYKGLFVDYSDDYSPAGCNYERFVKENFNGPWDTKMKNDNERARYIIIHELGHALQYSYRNQSIDWEEEANAFRETVKELAKKEYGEDYDFDSDTSDYGKRNSLEWFAETFASAYTSVPSKAALVLRKHLLKMSKDRIEKFRKWDEEIRQADKDSQRQE